MNPLEMPRWPGNSVLEVREPHGVVLIDTLPQLFDNEGEGHSPIDVGEGKGDRISDSGVGRTRDDVVTRMLPVVDQSTVDTSLVW